MNSDPGLITIAEGTVDTLDNTDIGVVDVSDQRARVAVRSATLRGDDSDLGTVTFTVARGERMVLGQRVYVLDSVDGEKREICLRPAFDIKPRVASDAWFVPNGGTITLGRRKVRVRLRTDSHQAELVIEEPGVDSGVSREMVLKDGETVQLGGSKFVVSILQSTKNDRHPLGIAVAPAVTTREESTHELPSATGSEILRIVHPDASRIAWYNSYGVLD